MTFYINPALVPAYSFTWWNIYLVGSGTIWMDDFVLKELGEIEGYVVPEPPMPNLIKNGSFEEEGIWTYASSYSRIQSDDAIDGEYIVGSNIETRWGNDNFNQSNGISVGKNRVLTLGFDLRADENADGRFRVAFTPNTGSADPTIIAEVDLTAEWMRYEMTFVSPSTEEFSRYWNNFRSTGDSGFLYVDNITLQDLGEAAGPVDSTITSKPSVKTQPPLPDGVGNGTIIPPDMGEKPELSLPSLETLDSKGVTIYLSTPDSYPELEEEFSEDLDFIGGSDGFAVRLAGNTIHIFGSIPDGTLNGVYDFIESNLGVLWTRAVDIGTLYDPLPSIKLIRYNYHDKSPLEVRGWHLVGTGADGSYHADPATEIMMSRNKLNAELAEVGSEGMWNRQQSVGINPIHLGHNLHYWLLRSPSFKALSEEEQIPYWSTDTNGNPTVGKGQVNFWNPDAAAAIAESVNAFLDMYETEYISVGQQDGGTVTQRPIDQDPFEYAPGQFVQPDDPKFFSTVVFSFINDVAKLVKVKHPDVTLNTYAYTFTQNPPYVDIEDNVSITIAPVDADLKFMIDDPSSPLNKAAYENMLEWKEKTDKIIIYEYYGSFPHARNEFERPLASRIQNDLQFYAANNFKGVVPEGIVDVETNKLWEISTLTMWLYSKLTWNPYADIQVLTEQFCHKAYGDASEHLLEYYRLLQETWDNNYTFIKWSVTLQTYIRTFYSDIGHNAMMQTALDQAWDAANEVQKQRIAPIKDAFERNTADIGDQLKETAKAKKTHAGLDTILETLDMNNPIWADAYVLEDFRNSSIQKPVDGTKTKVRLLWDEDNLYIAYENFDTRISDLKKTGLNERGTWWAGDSDDVETYLSAENPRTNPEAEYRVFFSNPLAEQTIRGEGKKIIANPEPWYSSAKIFDEEGIENDRWVVIQAVPFKNLGIDEHVNSSTELNGYFYRGHYAPNFTNIGWGGAFVWSTADFRNISLEEPLVDIKSIEITSEPTKVEYKKGEELDLKGLVVTATYSDDSTDVVTDYEVNSYNKELIGEQTIIVTYAGKTATFTVTVVEREEPVVTLESIEITNTPAKVKYEKGEELDLEGLVVTATYSDDSTDVVTDYEVRGYNKDLIGEQAIIVSYAGKMATLTVTVVEREELKDPEEPKDTPIIVSGQNSTYQQGRGRTLTFISNAAFEDFISVAVNDKIISADKYSLSEGSIVVELKADYLNTLEVGTYKLSINSTTGTATTYFTLIEKEAEETEADEDVAPETGDSVILWVMWLLSVVSIVGIITLVVLSRRKKQYNRQNITN